jgi:nitroreductase
MGVDTCPLEGIEPEKYDEVLQLPQHGYATSVACAAGYRAEDDKYAQLAKVRFAAEEMIVRI